MAEEAGYVPTEGDVVVFPLAPTPWNRDAEYTVTTVWGDGGECTLHRYEGDGELIYPSMSAASMRDLGVTLVRPGAPASDATRAADAAARDEAVKDQVLDEVIDVLDLPRGEASVRYLAGEVFDRAFTLGKQAAAGPPALRGQAPPRRRAGHAPGGSPGSGPSPR